MRRQRDMGQTAMRVRAENRPPGPEGQLNRDHGVPMRLVSGRTANVGDDERLRVALRDHFRLVWRLLRRLGVEESTADDAAQHAFLTLSARLPEIEPGAERAFLVGSCSGIAANARRRRERAPTTSEDAEPIDRDGMTPEDLLMWKQRRAALDAGLAALTLDHRTVFVLFELEGFSLPEIAETLKIPLGTATSRLRRARSAFEAWVEQQTAEEES